MNEYGAGLDLTIANALVRTFGDDGKAINPIRSSSKSSLATLLPLSPHQRQCPEGWVKAQKWREWRKWRKWRK